MKIIPRMGRVARRRLARLGRDSGDPATVLRFLAVAALGKGTSSPQVAEQLHIACSTVVRAAHVFAEHGPWGLYDGRCANGRRKADSEFRQHLAGLLEHTPDHFGWPRPTWTRELLCLQMQQDGWPKVAVCTMGRALAALGARLGLPKPVVLCPWPRDARLRKLAELRRLERRATRTEPVLYEDEVDINLNPKIGRDWMLPGQQRRIVTPGKNEKFYLAGALDVLTGKLHTTGAAKKNAALFCDLLRRLAEHYRHARRVHLILDNYGVHRAKETQRVLKELGGKIALHFLPPYCPDANRIERVWQDFHANVTRNHRCKTMKHLLANSRRYLDAYVWRCATGAAPLMRPARARLAQAA